MATGTTCMETAIQAKPTTAPAPSPAAAPSSWPTIIRCGVALAASSLLLWACFHPVGWGTYFGWVALVPFLILVRAQTRPWVVYLAAFACGMGLYVPVLSWMRVADRSMVVGWLALSVYCSLYFVAALYCVRALDRWRVPLVVSFPLVWAALEYFRSFFLTGFAWCYLAHTQHENLLMIQITDLGGVYLVSFLVTAVNALLFDFAYQFPEIRRWFGQRELEQERSFASWDFLNRSFMADWLFRRNLILESAAILALVIGAYVYGQKCLAHDRFRTGPTVCMLQSNLDQRLRENAAAEQNPQGAAQTVTEHFSALCTPAALDRRVRPDLIIWPETSFPRPWVEVSPKLPIGDVPTRWRDEEVDLRDALEKFAGSYTRVPHLLGMNSHYLDENGKHLKYNSALLLNAQGRIADRFDKVHRLPFGEYVPLKDWLPFLSMLTPYEGDFGIQAGEKLTRFQLGKHRFGVLICYEDTDPALARRYLQDSDDGPPVDFLVNMSNDGWFDGSSEHEEHLVVSRFRAIECRRALVRAVNMGVSAVIDSNGRVLKPTEVKGSDPPVWLVTPGMMGFENLPASEWHHYKKRWGILKAIVPIDDRASVYAWAGDWLPIGCWAALLGGGTAALVRRRFQAAPQKNANAT